MLKKDHRFKLKNLFQDALAESWQRRAFFLLALFFAVSLCGGCLTGLADENKKSVDLDRCRLMIEKALTAYNENSYDDFYSDFSSEKKSTTKNVFLFKWVRGYKDRYGIFVEKRLDLKKSRLEGEYPLLVYRAVFEKNDDMVISVNFKEQDGEFKIYAIRIDPRYVESETGFYWVKPGENQTDTE